MYGKCEDNLWRMRMRPVILEKWKGRHRKYIVNLNLHDSVISPCRKFLNNFLNFLLLFVCLLAPIAAEWERLYSAMTIRTSKVVAVIYMFIFLPSLFLSHSRPKHLFYFVSLYILNLIPYDIIKIKSCISRG